jgi:hypothetical protein
MVSPLLFVGGEAGVAAAGQVRLAEGLAAADTAWFAALIKFA